ncbi:MAG: peptide chain release factor N(5)-glutamine methyltransferase [Lachnospiraceae bacterium]|nr:peptide chain release factor N(5)-glutamine methyltransferase [Lachnospiraceae bacterium]
MTYATLYREGVGQLQAAGVKAANTDARLLLEFVCKTGMNTLFSHPDKEISKEEEILYKEFILRRKKGEPVQYITGEQEFMGLNFKTDPSTLIPRLDTESVVEDALSELHDGMRILDLCTGSGCILLSLLKYSNDCIGIGTDISAKAVELAQLNSQRLGIEATFLQGDLFEGVEGKFDMILSNPPYIETAVIETLDDEVRKFEPMSALDGGEDGLVFYRRIAKEAKRYLKRGAVLIFEIGYNQGESVPGILSEEGYQEIVVKKDLAGLNRTVMAKYYEFR